MRSSLPLICALTLSCCRCAPALTAAPICPLPSGLDAAWLKAGEVVLLGEQHHTFECPRFAGQVLCAAAKDRPVVLGLELEGTEQARLDAYLAGGPASDLVAGGFWQRVPGDGRESQAMLELITRARELTSAGRAVKVIAIDTDPAGNRDLGMATTVLAARAAAPDAPVVVLVGNVHVRKTLAVHKTLAWHLLAARVPIHSVNLVGGGELTPPFDAQLDLSPLTIAPPARESVSAPRAP
ncbi:MAG: hypothetical protein Q8L48_30040 [Archangium sp.]|nr:hypothetical protein [Archangium sp.]